MHWLKKSWKDTGFRVIMLCLIFGTMIWDTIITVLDFYFLDVQEPKIFFWSTVGGWSIALLTLLITYLTRNRP